MTEPPGVGRIPGTVGDRKCMSFVIANPNKVKGLHETRVSLKYERDQPDVNSPCLYSPIDGRGGDPDDALAKGFDGLLVPNTILNRTNRTI